MKAMVSPPWVRLLAGIRVTPSTLLPLIFPPVLLAPVPQDSSSAPPATEFADAPDEASRDNSFQILADGTQELSALLGLFATESVENYAVDFGRPFLAVAMASASMLGVLGWIKAMVRPMEGSHVATSMITDR